MKKIVSLLLFAVLLIPALLAVEYIPVEENPRIRITGYEVGSANSHLKTNSEDGYLTAYDMNYIRIDYVSAYSDIDYTLKQEPKTEKVMDSGDIYYVSYEEKVPFRIEFKRASNPDIIYYQDIEIPCQKPDLVSVDVPISIYTGNTTEFGAVSGNEVYAQVLLPDGIEYSPYGDSNWFVTDEEDNLIFAGYDARYLNEYSPVILFEEEAIAGKYKLCIEVLENSERKIVIKEFEVVD